MLVHISDLQVGDQLIDDIFTPTGIHILSAGTTVTKKHISSLFGLQIDFVQIAPRKKTAEVTSSIESVPEIIDIPKYNTAVDSLKNIFDKAFRTRIVSEEDTNEALLPLLQNVSQQRDMVSLLLSLNMKDNYTYAHSVQVGMLAFSLAKWLGFNEENAIMAGKAGYLHDIGKCQIDNAILNKPGKLTLEEYEEIKKHTLFGFEILEQIFPNSPISAAALEHHERFNGNGYPYGKKQDIHIISRIIAVVDTYSAMTMDRVYQSKSDLLTVLRTLHEMSFSDFDPKIVSPFIQHMLPNFIGKKILLTSGEEGTIVWTNPTDFFRPLVKLGSNFIDLSQHRHLKIQSIRV
ncbi:MAG: hypothetical protein A2189_03050 [Paenibacillus sp. RIFOXYA1_FULL_44_5]|nr:MAG: hypothetical protein A2189_03050 [Paenibacillus sp. RIFOXYA1_FULL_44_5]